MLTFGVESDRKDTGGSPSSSCGAVLCLKPEPTISIKDLFNLRTMAGPMHIFQYHKTWKIIHSRILCVSTSRTHAILELVLVKAIQLNTEGT